MRALLNRLAANAGSALAAGATVLAVGAALGAVGLAETQKQAGSPFRNPLVLIGVGIIIVAAAWSVAILVIAMVATANTDRFHILLGHALNDGEALEQDGAPKPLIDAWGQQTHDLIEAGLGPAAARVFLSEWDLGTQLLPAKFKPGHPWLQRRLMRLTRLMESMHLMHVGPTAKLPHWRYQSSRAASSIKGET
jgi:hypothetical protein